MHLQLKKSLDNPGRNLTTLILLPDFFFFPAIIVSFCILSFHLWACFPPYISPLRGQKLYSRSCHLASFISEGSGKGKAEGKGKKTGEKPHPAGLQGQKNSSSLFWVSPMLDQPRVRCASSAAGIAVSWCPVIWNWNSR